eukprot:TRINITY_DN38210_c0_g1_i1.p1 TRINITY_DN38210_c0_g1~~TRINITY_DN38210_c0_g1_i1.p1  ORF type:complete len:222 (+),score=45.32 TRINITY_DN38210_c0_g1_i1:60-725(+)
MQRVSVSECNLVIVADDSGSMGLGFTPAGARACGEVSVSRWEVLGCDVDAMLGLVGKKADVFFHSGGDQLGVEKGDQGLARRFTRQPDGRTKMLEAIERAVQRHGARADKQTLVVVATDSRPTCGVKALKKYLQAQAHLSIRFLFIPYTSSHKATGWLNKLESLPNTFVAPSYPDFCREQRSPGRPSPAPSVWLSTNMANCLQFCPSEREKHLCPGTCNIM